MSTPITVGVTPGHIYTGWVVRRGDELVAAGTWTNPRATGVDARRAPVPPPTAEALSGFVQTVRGACDGESPAAVGVTRVAMPPDGSRSKRALHTVGAVAAVAGAVAGAWAGVVCEVEAPGSPVDQAALPAALKTPPRKGGTAAGRVSGGYRGGLVEARAAWTVAGLAAGIPVTRAPGTTGTPGHRLASAAPANTGGARRIAPDAFRRARPEAATPATPAPATPATPGDPARDYTTALLGHIHAARPTTPAQLAVACEVALALVTAPPGLAITATQLATAARRAPGTLPPDYHN